MKPRNLVAKFFAEKLKDKERVNNARASMGMSLREFCESPDFARNYLDPNNTGTLYTDVGWAIIDASDGKRPNLDDERALAIMGCAPRDFVERSTPFPVVNLGLGRGAGKTSRLLAIKCLHAAWTTDLSTVGPGDEPVALLVGPKLKHAQQSFRFVLACIHRSPLLKASIARDARGRALINKTSVTLQRPDGRRVRVEVAAASKGGDAARGYTVIFAGMEEACFFRSGDDAAVNDGAIFNAITGAARGVHQIVWIVSTPWIEGVGLMEEFIGREWGYHRHALVIARVPTKWVNPNADPDGSKEAAKRAMPGGDVDADREFYAIPMPKGSRSFFDAESIAACLALELPAFNPIDRSAGSDLGFVNDAAALIVLFKYDDDTYGSPVLREIAPQKGHPLVPGTVCREFAEILRSHGVHRVWSDRVYSESHREHLAPYQINLSFNEGGMEARNGRFFVLRDLIAQRRLRLGSLTVAARESLREQLLAVTLVPVAGGKPKIVIPRSTISEVADGNGTSYRHGDGVAALVEGLCGIGAKVVSQEAREAAEAQALGSKPRQTGFSVAHHKVGYNVPMTWKR